MADVCDDGCEDGKRVPLRCEISEGKTCRQPSSGSPPKIGSRVTHENVEDLPTQSNFRPNLLPRPIIIATEEESPQLHESGAGRSLYAWSSWILYIGFG